MNWKVTTQPTFEPVTISELKAQIRQDLSNEDVLLTSYIVAARQFCERRIGLAIPAQTITLKMDSFPSCDRIELPMSNLISVTSVSYVDANGVTQTPHPTGSPQADYYGVDTYSTPGALFLKSGQAWPADLLLQRQAVTIVYRAGWAAVGDIPQSIKQAVALLAAHWDRNREPVGMGGVSAEVDFAVSALLDQWRVYSR